MQSRRQSLDWPGSVVVLLVALVQFFRAGALGSQCWRPGESLTFCIDQYWVNQLLKNYAGGFTKRGFSGEVLRHLFPSGLDLIWLNAFALLLLMALALLLYALVRTLMARSGWPPLLISVLLLLAPFGKALAETALDPLQLSVLLVAAVLLTPAKSPARDGAVVVSFVLASLIYEGCALLLLPVGFWLMRATPWRWLPPVLAAGLLLVFQQPDAPLVGQAAREALVAINPLTGQELRYRDGGGLAASVSFSFNVKQEFGRYLTDAPRETISRMARSLGAVLVYGIAVLTAMAERRASERPVACRVWFSWVPVALPFVLITHDWLRYGVILLLLAMLVTAAQCEPLPLESGPATRPELLAIGLLAMAAAVGPATGDVRKFLPHNYFHASLLMLLVACVVLVVEQRRLSKPSA